MMGIPEQEHYEKIGRSNAPNVDTAYDARGTQRAIGSRSSSQSGQHLFTHGILHESEI